MNFISKKTMWAFLGIITITFACGDIQQAEKEESSKEISIVDQGKLSQGFNILETSCFACHSPDANIENRVAPPMEAVKRHYLDETQTKAEFIAEFSSFLKNPKVENSKMPNALKRFGLMPKMPLTDDQISLLTNYVYETKLEAPEWFDEHYQEERAKYKKQQGAMSFLEQGRSHVMATKSVLGKNLLGAINSKGTADAVSFCNTRAITITDSMSVVQKVNIKRVSDQPRNPNNKANKAELDYIQKAKDKIADGEKAKPLVTKDSGKNIGYYPIMTNAMCLQCHGQVNSEISQVTQDRIKSLYPEDLATGYGENQLRGIWVVEMEGN